MNYHFLADEMCMFYADWQKHVMRTVGTACHKEVSSTMTFEQIDSSLNGVQREGGLDEHILRSIQAWLSYGRCQQERMHSEITFA
jgi:hypothetical protein